MLKVLSFFRLFPLITCILSLAAACAGRPGPRPGVSVQSRSSIDQYKCPSPAGLHSIFAVFVDGKEVGREVRTDITDLGPFGKERVIYSHLVTRMKMGSARFEARTVEAQRTLFDSGILLRGSHVAMDQLKARTFLVGYDGNEWSRVVQARSSVTSPLEGMPAALGKPWTRN